MAKNIEDAYWLIGNYPSSTIIGKFKKLLPIKTIKITIKQISDHLSDVDDRIDSPVGKYKFEAYDIDSALDRLHRAVPIGCLEDYHVSAEEIGLK